MSGRVLGIGTPLYDVIKFVKDDELLVLGLKKGTTSFPSGEGPSLDDCGSDGLLGGSCTNVLKVIARCGIPCAIHGVVGDDSIGRHIDKLLEKSSLTPLLQRIGGSSSGVVTCYVTPDAERTMTPSLGASKEFAAKHLDPAHFTSAAHVHIEGYTAFSEKVLLASLQHAKKAQVTTSFDLASIGVIETFKDSLLEQIPDINYVFGNRQEMAALTGEEDMKAALETFDANQTVVATDGANGCNVKASGETDAVHYEANKVKTFLDSTGAGDFFCGGFLSGALQKQDIVTCVKMGNTFASAVIQVQGADLSKKQWQEVVRGLQK